MKDKVVAIMSRVLNVPAGELGEDASPDTVKNWDSLKHMALILSLEEDLGVTFSDDEIAGTLTVRGIVDIVGKKTCSSP